MLGSHTVCPLCQLELEPDEKGAEEDLFPHLKELYKRNLLFKIITFISLLLVITSVFMGMWLGGNHSWVYIIIAAVGCFWIVFYIAFRKRKNVEKAILYTEVLIAIICRSWDYAMGNRGWSMDFVIPILGIVVLVVLFMISRLMHPKDDDDMIYLIIGGLLGLVPLLFYWLHLVHIALPSLLCAAVSLIYFTAVVVFQGDRMIGELERRMHV